MHGFGKFTWPSTIGEVSFIGEFKYDKKV